MQPDNTTSDINILQKAPVTETTHLFNDTSHPAYNGDGDSATIFLPVQYSIHHSAHELIKRFIQEYVKPTSFLFINSIIFGGSVKAWLDPILKALVHDINEVLPEDIVYDSRSNSIIGAYIALTTGLAGYFMYRYIMRHSDIENIHTYRLLKLSQFVGALGLSGYIYTGDNYIITAACSSSYPKHVSICPESPADDPRLPLKIVCCIQKDYTTETSLGVATNDYTLVFLSPAGFKLASTAMDVLRYDYKKRTKLNIAADISSAIATTAAYFIVRYGITPKQALYYTIVPFSTFYLTTWSIPLLLSALPFKNKKNILGAYQPNRFWQYTNTSLKALANGIGRAALYHAIALTYEFQCLPYEQGRITGRYAIAGVLAIYTGHHAFQSNSIKELGKKFLTIIVPEEKFTDELNFTFSSNISWRKIAGTAAVAGTTFVLTSVFIKQAIESQFGFPANDDRATQYLTTVATPAGMALRFGLAGFGLITYGIKSFWRDYHNNFNPIKKADLNNNLKLDWPSLASVATAITMAIGIYKAIEDAVNGPNGTSNLYHKIIMTMLSVLLLAACLFGDLIFKRYSRSSTTRANLYQTIEEINIVRDIEKNNINTQSTSTAATRSQRDCNPRGWFNHWCGFLAPVNQRSGPSAEQNTNINVRPRTTTPRLTLESVQ